MAAADCPGICVAKVLFEGEFRRFVLGDFASLDSTIRQLFSIAVDAPLVTKYTDEDGDPVTFCSDAELTLAKQFAAAARSSPACTLRGAPPVLRISAMSPEEDQRERTARQKEKEKEKEPKKHHHNKEKEEDEHKKEKKARKDEKKERHLRALQQPRVPAPPAELGARFLRDITVDDGTTFPPLTPFVKTWLVCNSGPESWPEGCHLRYVGGDMAQNAPDVTCVPLTGSLPTGAEIELSVQLVAPAQQGRYTYYWKLSTKDGVKFGERLSLSFKVADDSSDEGELHARSQESGGPSAEESAELAALGPAEYEKPLQQLVQMGFPNCKANLRALREQNGSVEATAHILRKRGLYQPHSIPLPVVDTAPAEPPP